MKDNGQKKKRQKIYPRLDICGNRRGKRLSRNSEKQAAPLDGLTLYSPVTKFYFLRQLNYLVNF
jgi:hypothetical protein